MEQAALKQLTSAVHDFSLTQYAQASSFTFFAWDYFVTLPNESRYFWSGQWTYARILFFLNRYQTMGWMIFNVAVAFVPYKSNSFCLAWGRHIAEASACCVLFGVQLILACRVYGLYRRDRRIAALLTVLLAANLTVQIYLLLHFAADSPRVVLPWKPGQYTCTGGHGQPQGLFLSIIPSLVFDIAVLALVIVQGLSHIRTSRRNTGFLGVRFIRVIMKDSVAHVSSSSLTGTKSSPGRSFTHLVSCNRAAVDISDSLRGVFTPTRTHKFCQAWVHYIVGISALMVVFSVNLILSLRIFGLYGRARWVAILLGIMLPATITVQSYVLARFSPDFISIPLPFSKNIVPCNPSSTEHLYLALIPGLVFDTLVLTLALVRGLIHIQRQRVVGFRGSNIVRVLTRDSASYFLVILLIYTSLIISWVKSPGVEAFATFGYGLATISVAGSRMLFNLKRESMPSM